MITTQTPVERRTAAVQGILDAAIPVPTARVILIRRADIAQRIYNLGKLGRTEAWIRCLTDWMNVVIAAKDEHLRWAVLEYGIRCQNR